MTLAEMLLASEQSITAEPSYIHRIQDDPDEEIEISPYQKRLQQMREYTARWKRENPDKVRKHRESWNAIKRNERKKHDTSITIATK